MSLHNFSSRPTTKSSFSSQSLHSNQTHHTTPVPKQTSTRVMSNLKRSNELLSVEEELKQLLKNSNLNFKQKQAFQEMLESTFDLFQVPLHDGSRQESLIDSSSIELYSKMQSLVTSLTSLIMNEEESTRHEISQLHDDDADDDTKEDNETEDSTEFSDGEGQEQVQYKSNTMDGSTLEQKPFPRPASISSFKPLSRSSSIIDTTRRRPSFNQRSPLIMNRSSPSSFRNTVSPTLTNADLNIRQNNRYEGLRSNNGNSNFKSSFQVMQTPVPRSFSTRTERPKSMFVNKHDLNQMPSFGNGNVNGVEMKPSRSIHNLNGILDPSDNFHQEFGSDHLGGSQYYDGLAGESSRYSSRRGSIRNEGSVRDSASKSKRYSMRF